MEEGNPVFFHVGSMMIFVGQFSVEETKQFTELFRRKGLQTIAQLIGTLSDEDTYTIAIVPFSPNSVLLLSEKFTNDQELSSWKPRFNIPLPALEGISRSCTAP